MRTRTNPPIRVFRCGILGGALVVLLGAGACSTVPGASEAYVVQSVTTRGPYLDATLVRQSTKVRFFFPAANTSCQEVVRVDHAVEYVSLGALGLVRDSSESCEPVGIGSLGWWRRQRGRPAVGPLPAATARFQLAYQDAEIAMVRGRFPLTGLVNWAGGYDTIAVLPQIDACRRLVEQGEATIEYRASGDVPLRLLSGEGAGCPIVGLVQPL